jgi:predicted nucleotidyltransferase
MALGVKNINSTLMRQSLTLMYVQDVSQAYAGAAVLPVADAVLVMVGEAPSHDLEALLQETEALPVQQEGLHCLAWPQEAQ